jgi:hypothetical protein
VRLVSPTGGAAGGSGNLSTSSSYVAKLAAHPKFVWVFNANCDGTIIYNNRVLLFSALKMIPLKVYADYTARYLVVSLIHRFTYTTE